MRIALDKVVMDTNVFVSAVFFSGPPFQILNTWQSGKFELAVSQEILDEYRRVGEVLAEEYSNIGLKPMLNFVIDHAKVYKPAKLNGPVCEDPDDDKFFACALASESKIIISGDKHLLKVSGYEGIEVLKPREFVDRYLS
ncbi:MAG: putative toxin-antitoxin system toxin component, PIN family [Anaerolineae bacterium]|jgi:putative PIN family toxin of toxin-antitoxin system|nr:putative toxin-antitoxin system toxin component, PIN family [Anaerolineae bacterium]MBL8104955.1 putative toxin-antitoxin system toxin component, PIN family [Anaerolineales bacterium]MCC7189457.1 putative toxin-antitoxin system toxin component, PIN family [Anaerolineales bacterium]